MKVSRRELAVAIAAAATTSSAASAASPQSASAADPLQTARDRLKAAAAALEKEKIPMATEPACTFHAE